MHLRLVSPLRSSILANVQMSAASFRATQTLKVRPTAILGIGHSYTTSSAPHRTDGKWLSSIKSRIGKCILWGLKDSEAPEVAAILKDLAVNWREYAAGANGYLIDEKRRGLYRHPVVWGDMDSKPPFDIDILTLALGFLKYEGHVNNVVYNKWAESARMIYARNFATHIDPANAEKWNRLCTPVATGWILRSIKVDYKFPLEWPDRVSVYHKLNSVHKDSFALDVMILSEKHQRPAAKCHEEIVVYDYRAKGRAAIPPWMKDQFDTTLQLQKEAMEDAHDKMEDIERKVDEIERRVMGRAEM
ncbi:thioesterase-like superfamily-domain-containing protein [Peziza echinospora]|nr:thioesterase-like superfamily-domain-containing protein [Peziza echinospora]